MRTMPATTGIQLISACLLIFAIAAVHPGSGVAQAQEAGYWNFCEGAGTTLHDVSGNENHGEIWGADWECAEEWWSLRFDGTTEYVVVVDDPSLHVASGTIEVIFRPAGGFQVGDPSEQLLDKEVGGLYEGDLEIFLDTHTGQLTVEHEIAGERQRVRSLATSWDESIYCMAYTFGPQGMELFVDEIAQDWNPSPASLAENHRQLTFGFNYSQGVAGFDGWMYAVRISEAVLGPGEFLTVEDCCCCNGSPSHPETWGSLKSMYRTCDR
ncbi:MAG: hypothetical protein GF330_12480 [Candidatus Eisenbacteria bacterium]|nr:hypothetical protein [Candidatus Eisenbacteria bacterium]